MDNCSGFEFPVVSGWGGGFKMSVVMGDALPLVIKIIFDPKLKLQYPKCLLVLYHCYSKVKKAK